MPRPSRNRLGPIGFDEAQEDTAQHGARDVSDAAQDRGGEGLDAGDEPHEEVDLLEHDRVEHAGGPGSRAADDEGHGDHPVDVDAHEVGRLLVLGHGADGLADPGALDERHRAPP